MPQSYLSIYLSIYLSWMRQPLWKRVYIYRRLFIADIDMAIGLQLWIQKNLDMIIQQLRPSNQLLKN